MRIMKIMCVGCVAEWYVVAVCMCGCKNYDSIILFSILIVVVMYFMMEMNKKHEKVEVVDVVVYAWCGRVVCCVHGRMG